jgi:8-oxo-dGTP diphosphatase
VSTSWYDSLAVMYGSAAALLFSPSGELLVVKPNYRPMWSLPGGMIEDGEAPHLACEREVHEELGLTITAERLLSVTWIATDGKRPQPLVAFLFDGGELPANPDIVLQSSELDEWRWVPAADLGSYLPVQMATRIRTAIQTRSANSGAAYLSVWPEGGRP